MTHKTNPDDPAFPCDAETILGHEGMTKREYFAVLIASGRTGGGSPESTAWAAVHGADQLIEELNK